MWWSFFRTFFVLSFVCFLWSNINMIISMKSLIESSLTGQYAAIHKLSPVHLQIYLLFYSLCYKGNRIKSTREISYGYIADTLNQIHGLTLNKRQVKYAADRLVSLRLLERFTVNFKSTIGTQTLPDKASYYRLVTPPRPKTP